MPKMGGLRTLDIEPRAIGKGFDEKGHPGKPDRRRPGFGVKRQRGAAEGKKRRRAGAAKVQTDMGVRKVADRDTCRMPTVLQTCLGVGDQNRPIRRDLQKRARMILGHLLDGLGRA